MISNISMYIRNFSEKRKQKLKPKIPFDSRD